MPVMVHEDASIDYQVHGEGFPLMLFAPGGMNSVAQMWRESPHNPGQPMPWIDPTQDLSDRFQVIAMDQRNAGRSSGPVRAEDGWATYTGDHVALLDHLGLPRTHLMGGCIGSSYCLSFCRLAPDRVAAAVLQNPIGLTSENRNQFEGMFDDWAKQLKQRRPGLTDDALDGFRENMFGGDFVFSVDREFVRACPVPFLVLAGNDTFHPTEVAEEIAELAPSAELVLEWAGPARHEATRERIRDFLSVHTP